MNVGGDRVHPSGFKRVRSRLCCIFVLALLSLPSAYGQSGAGSSAQADLEALVKAARAEAELTFYTSHPEGASKRLADAFDAKYGIKTKFIRLASVQILQRYGSEAEAGNIAADLLMSGGRVLELANEGIRKGWVEPISQSGLPVLRGEFPAKYNKGPSAVISIAPWGIGYNTDKVKGADIPKTWEDILNPKWRGQILLPSPYASDEYLNVWASLLDKYGEAFFARLRAQNPRQYPGGTQAVQALAAGEGAFVPPVVPSSLGVIKEKSAPVAMSTPDYTSGAEVQVMLTSRAKAKHPGAARLFANYVMSLEGNRIFNDDHGGFTIYDVSHLPGEYQSPRPGLVARKDEFAKLLGF